MLLQRIMAAHCVTDEEAKDIMKSIDEDMGSNSLTHCLRSINGGLKLMGMEIVTMIGEDGEKWHALIDRNACDVARKCFPRLDIHSRAFIRLVMEKLAEEGPTVRSTLINLRGDLKENLKMDLDSADECIQSLLEERWLVVDKKKGNDMNCKIKLAPRAFLELTSLLTEAGYPKEELPQFLFHR